MRLEIFKYITERTCDITMSIRSKYDPSAEASPDNSLSKKKMKTFSRQLSPIFLPIIQFQLKVPGS
jgi:hypothetical protein